MNRRLLAFLLLVPASAFPVLARTPVPAPGSRIPLDPQVVHGRLPNGLVYFIRHNATPKGQAELRLVINAGSVEEDDDQRGLAHVIEHLCFRSTHHFPNSEIVHFLQSLGSKFGADINGRTGFDDTRFRLSVPTGKPGALKEGLLMLRDWAGDVNFDQADVDKVRKVVTEEWRLGRGPAQRMMQKEAPVFFQGSRYAARLPIGRKAVIEGAPISAITRFYHDWYRPDNMALVIVGDVDPAAIRAQITSLFGDLKNPEPERAKPDLTVPLPRAAVCSSVSDPEMGYTAVRVWYPQTTRPERTVADLRRRLARQLVLQALNLRLAELSEQDPAPCELAQASFGLSPARSLSVGTLVAIVRNGAVPAGLQALIQEADRADRRGFTEAEFERSKAALLKTVDEQYAERDHRQSATLAAIYVAGYLHAEPAPGAQWDYDTSRALVATLNLGDMNAADRSLFGNKGLIVSVESPQAAGTATLSSPQLAQIVAKAEATPLAAVQERRLPKTLMPVPPAPGRIVSRHVIASIGVTELTLANGVRVVLKPSTFKQDEIVFSAFRPGGLSALPQSLVLAGECAPGYVSKAGLGRYSATDLRKMLAGKALAVAMLMTPYLDEFRGRCTTPDLETTLQLIHMSFDRLRRDPGAYASILDLNHSFEANVLMNPTLSFLNEALDLRYGHNPRAPHLVQPAGAWKALTLGKVLEAYHDRFGTADGFTFIFVGSFKAAAIEPLLARYLGSLPGGSGKARARDVGIRQIPGPFAKTIRRGSEPKAMVVLDYDHPVSRWSSHQSHILWSLGNILQRTLIDRLRIDQGSVYTLKVKSTLEKIPYRHYTLELAAPCAPGHTAGVIKTVDAVIRRLQTQGPTPAEIEKEVAAQTHDLRVQAEENGAWLTKLELICKYDKSFERLERPDALVKLVTRDHLRHAAATYLSTDRWVCFKLEPKS